MAELKGEISQRAGEVLKTLVSSSEQFLAESRKRGEDAMKLYKASDYNFMYNADKDDELFFKACVKKTWEAFTVLIGYLTPDKPHREIAFRPRSAAPGSLEELRNDASAARLAVVQDMLNWSVNETDFQNHMRRAILDFLARGRGVLWTGIHPRKDVITTMWDSALNFNQDPNALIDEDVMWKSRDLIMPRSRAYQMYPNSVGILQSANKVGKRFSDASSMAGSTNSVSNGMDCIKLRTCYMLNSITEYEGGSGLKDAMARAGVTDDDMMAQVMSPDPLRYVFTDDGALVDVSPWEVPYWKDGLWPCTEIATFDDNASLTPISPLDAALPFSHAINWIVTLIMGKSRTTMRLLMALVNQNGDGLKPGDIQKALIGKDMEAITLNILGENADLRSYIQQFNWDNNWLNPAMGLLSMLEDKFDQLSGITEIMRTGQPGMQDRSAEATRLRRETSFNRADDMRQSVMKAHDEIARKESIALQFLKNSEYIGERMGESAAMAYGYLGEKEDQDPMTWMTRLIEQGSDPQIASQVATSRAIRAYTIEDVMHEANYETAVGDGPRHDRAAQIEALDEFHNQTAPVLAQSGNPADMAMVYLSQAERFERVGLSHDLVKQLRNRAEELQQLSMQPPQPAGPDQQEPQQRGGVNAG